MRCYLRMMIALPVLLLVVAAAPHPAPPVGIAKSFVGGSWNEVLGTEPLPAGRTLVWERQGGVWILEPDGTRAAAPALNLRDEVGGWRDYGLMSVVAHPQIEQNGFIYLMYVVDRHHLDFADTPQYSPTTDTYFTATIGRITRYRLTPESGFTAIDLASRTVLVGESASTGIPIVHQSHGPGTLMFGRDGTLLATTGDAASYNEIDTGGQVDDGWVNDGLAHGILRSKENIGAFRSQLIDCLNGKVLRLDPATGNGVASNPWFDAAAPRSPKSRVFALGLRNPFRAWIEPGTGSTDPALANPGRIVIGDVGWGTWEDAQVCDGPRQNFGWPLFEGLTVHNGYWDAGTLNPDAPTGLASPAQHRFRELVRQDSLDPTFDQPLDPIAFIQAEQASANGAPVTGNDRGYQGTGYRDYQTNSGEWIDFTVQVPAGGTYTLFARYTMGGTASRTLRVSVDGVVAVNLWSFSPTGAWGDWRLLSTTLSLQPGTRVIRLATISNSGPNLDSIALVPAGQPAPTLAASLPTFEHRRPIVEWNHATSLARTPIYTNNAATAANVGSAAGAAGDPFNGFCAVGGPIVNDPAWPLDWRSVMLMGDFTGNWIRALTLDAIGRVTAVRIFDFFDPLEPSSQHLYAPVSIDFDPRDGSLWVAQWPDRLARYRPTCPTDLSGDRVIDGIDLGTLLSGWATAGPADINRDGVVDGADLGALLGSWGACP